jgi:hypothetical protein
MVFVPKAKQISWTRHAEAKMAFYKLSKQRVLRVIHSPKRVEEGVAPKTVAMMQPNSVHMRTEFVLSEASRRDAKPNRRTPLRFKPTTRAEGKDGKPKEVWSQEIWVMTQDLGKQRKIISAWRYPGMTRPRSADSLDIMRKEYREFLGKTK